MWDPWARGWPSSSGVSSSSSEQEQEDALAAASCLDLAESFGGFVNLRGGALRRIFLISRWLREKFVRTWVGGLGRNS